MAKKSQPKKKLSDTSESNEAVQIFDTLSEQHPDLLKGIEPSKQRELKKVFTVGMSMVRQTLHSGPLPAPETLEAYANIIPNGAERIMEMAEKEQSFRHEFDRTLSRREKNIESRGQILGFILCLIVLSGGIYAIIIGKQLGGLTAVIGALAVLVGAFYFGNKKK